MKISSNPRMCVITRERLPREELVKITRINSVWNVEKDEILFGRSIYIKLNSETLKKFKKQKKRFKIESENFEKIIIDLEELCEKNI